MINNIIAIADMDSQGGDKQKSEYDINVCCKECIDVIVPTLKPTIDLEYIPTTIPLIVCAARPWMVKVLLILLGNANKFTEKGKIILKSEEDKEKNVIRLIVEDTGIGVDEEYKEKIFDRFYKINNFSTGVGLGLAVSRQIMDMIGGDIYVDSTYKKGSRFVVEWPMS